MEKQYKIKEIKEFKKDTVYNVLKRRYYKNKFINFIYGSDWFLIGIDGYYNPYNKFETIDKSEAEQFIKWCQLNDK